jgi:2-hydroxychromene-2-carboxylate isomerase
MRGHSEESANVRAMLSQLIAQAVTSPTLRSFRWARAATLRRIRNARPKVFYFHQIDDPYSHLTAQLLPALADLYDVDFVPHLVPAPVPAAAPEAARLAAYARKDAALLATMHGLIFQGTQTPDEGAVRTIAGHLADASTVQVFAQPAIELDNALWSGDEIPPTTEDGKATLARGAALRQRLGHYLGATFYFEGEWYWGLDRLPYLETRLALFRKRGAAPIVKSLEESNVANSRTGGTIDFFLSFRSPYTYLAANRVQRLAARHGATVRLRFVLPMVMRGLPVPRIKQIYIMRDTKREAERLGMPFGRIVDPVGPGVERGLAVLHHAIAEGRGAEFVESFLRGAFAEGVDATTDAGLLKIAARAGLSAAQVNAALADPSWRAVAEANRVELFDLGLWGVPSFRVDGRDAHWGQDRLWAVERDLVTAVDAADSPTTAGVSLERVNVR